MKLRNRMGHPLIIQPARVKYLNLKVVRGDRTIYERNSTFELIFRDRVVIESLFLPMPIA